MLHSAEDIPLWVHREVIPDALVTCRFDRVPDDTESQRSYREKLAMGLYIELQSGSFHLDGGLADPPTAI